MPAGSRMINLLDFPAELIIRILAELDYDALICCKQTCKLFSETVDTQAQLQYIIELAVNGMEDSGLSSCPLYTADRLRLLKDRRESWDSMRYTSVTEIPFGSGQYELKNGIFSQITTQNSLIFTRLPSKLRGLAVEERIWMVKDLPFEFEEFSCDVTQDLLVAVELNGGREQKVHLRSATTGEVHQEAPNPGFFTHILSDVFLDQPYIQLCGTYLSVTFSETQVLGTSDLKIWNWRTGDVLLCVYSSSLMSSVFLSERHILIIHVVKDKNEPTLSVIDLTKPSKFSEPVAEYASEGFEDSDFELSLKLPAFHSKKTLESIVIHSDPMPSSCIPHSDLKLPFHIARDDRLLIISFHVINVLQVGNNRNSNLSLFVPTSTIMRHLPEEHNQQQRHLEWDEWGPKGTRMMPMPLYSFNWMHCSLGLSYALSLYAAGQQYAHLFDFNRAAVKQFKIQQVKADCDDGMRWYKSDPFEYSDDPDSGWEALAESQVVVEETVFPDDNRIFEQVVKTSLPFLSHMLPISALLPPTYNQDSPDSAGSKVYTLLLSEDAVILGCNVNGGRLVFVSLNF